MSAKYIVSSQQRVLQTLVALAGHEMEGLAPGEVARAVRTTASNTTRDLSNLREAGLAEPMETGRWRLSPRAAQIGIAVLKSLDDAQRRVAEVSNRYTRDR